MMANYKIRPEFKLTLNGCKAFSLSEGEQLRFEKFCMSHTGEYLMTLSKPKKRRSNTANAYYFGVVVPILADFIGEEDTEDVDRLLEAQFLKRKVVIKEKVFDTYGRCSKLSTEEFWGYIDRIVTYFGREYGVVIPAPDRDWAVHEQIAAGEFG